MSGPLRDKPGATTTSAPVTNTCLPAEKRPNKRHREGECLRASSERGSNPSTLVTGELRSSDPAIANRPQLRTVSRHSLYSIGGARGRGVESAITHRALQLASDGGLYVAPKEPLQCKRCQRFGHTQLNCGYAPRCIACGGPHNSGGLHATRDIPSAVAPRRTTRPYSGSLLSGRR